MIAIPHPASGHLLPKGEGIARQLSMDLRIPQACPLLALKVVSTLLHRTNEDVMRLIESAHLEFAFNLARRGSKNQLPVVWRQSVSAYLDGYAPNLRAVAARTDQEQAARLQVCLANVLPPDVAAMRAVELKARLGFCDRMHVIRMIADGSLCVDRSRAAGRSPWVTRASLVTFLTGRRM